MTDPQSDALDSPIIGTADAEKVQTHGYGCLRNVVTSVEFERRANPAGTTGGKLLRPSDGREAKDLDFIQCPDQRDEAGAHLP